MARTRLTRWRTPVAAAVVALVAAACGSTAHTPGGQQASGGAGGVSAGGQGLDAGTTGATNGTTGNGEVGATAGGGTTGAGAATGGGGGGTGAATAGGSGSGGATNGGAVATGTGATTSANGPGVTDTTIYVGVPYATNTGAANAALGAAGVSQGDDKTVSQILIDDVNAHGGVAGRKLVPVYAEIDATSPTPVDTEYQRVCDELTQDHKVAVVLSSGENDVFNACLQKRGVFLIDTDLSSSDNARFQRFPYFFALVGMSVDRIAAAEVTALAAQNYFTPWDASLGRAKPAGKAKVGIVTINTSSFSHAADQVLAPALTKVGYGPAPADVIKVPKPESNTDLGATSAAVSNAVLKLRSDGVEHVLILEESGVITTLFLNNAESQRYFPRYGANTQMGLQVLLDTGALPKDQIVGSVGLGWSPSIDITPSQNTDNGPYSSDARRKCIAMLKAHGYTPADTNAKAVALGDCNSVWFLQQVGNSIGSTFNRDTFRAGVEKLGGSWNGIDVFATYFGPNRHDGVAAYRHWSYDNGCGCMKYTSGNIAAP